MLIIESNKVLYENNNVHFHLTSMCLFQTITIFCQILFNIDEI